MHKLLVCRFKVVATLFFVFFSAVANANTLNQEDKRFAPYFERTMVFGHSITSGLMNKIFLGFRYGEGPANILVREYAKGSISSNISEGLGLPMESGFDKIVRLNTGQEGDVEWYQPWMGHRNIKVMQKAYSEATAIVSVDAFYMDVAFNSCEYLNPRYIQDHISRFVQKAHGDGKLVVLANVPDEDWSKTKPVARLAARNQWNEDCRKTFNYALKAACLPQFNCHILDMEKIVRDLNATDKITLKNGKSYHANYNSYFWWLTNRVRPDGVNVSPAAAQFMAEQILATIQSNFARMEAVAPTQPPAAEGLR